MSQLTFSSPRNKIPLLEHVRSWPRYHRRVPTNTQLALPQDGRPIHPPQRSLSNLDQFEPLRPFRGTVRVKPSILLTPAFPPALPRPRIKTSYMPQRQP